MKVGIKLSMLELVKKRKAVLDVRKMLFRGKFGKRRISCFFAVSITRNSGDRPNFI